MAPVAQGAVHSGLLGELRGDRAGEWQMSKSRAKGTRFESELVDYLHRATGFDLERRALHGNKDRGDIIGLPGWAIEAKNHKELRLADWLDEIRVEQLHASASFGAVVIKRRGKGAAGAYALLPMEVLVKLLPRVDR